MPHYCAFGCKETDVAMHVFPNPDTFPDHFKAWVALVGGKLESPSDYAMYKNKWICDIHFTDEHRNWNKQLDVSAIPSLHLRGQTLLVDCPDYDSDTASVDSSISTSSKDEAMASLFDTRDDARPATGPRLPSTSVEALEQSIATLFDKCAFKKLIATSNIPINGASAKESKPAAAAPVVHDHTSRKMHREGFTLQTKFMTKLHKLQKRLRLLQKKNQVLKKRMQHAHKIEYGKKKNMTKLAGQFAHLKLQKESQNKTTKKE